jgi:hypothetical protein
MISRILLSALVVLGALTLGCPAEAVAKEPWLEVRQSFHDDCQQYTGHANGICMRAASAKMQGLSEEARSLYRSCLDEGKSRGDCDEEREEFWRNKLIF